MSVDSYVIFVLLVIHEKLNSDLHDSTPPHMPLYANWATQCMPNDVLHNRRAYTNGITPYVY